MGSVHTLIGTAANANDATPAPAPLQGDGTEVFADARYQGVEEQEQTREAPVIWHVAVQRSVRRTLPKRLQGQRMELIEQVKANIRAKVNMSSTQSRSCSVIASLVTEEKNTTQRFTLLGFAKLVLARRWLLATDGNGPS